MLFGSVALAGSVAAVLILVTSMAELIPFIVGGISLFFHQRIALYWIAWGVIGTFILSVVNTWVLLVEILR
jgi:hypothetical protein